MRHAAEDRYKFAVAGIDGERDELLPVICDDLGRRVAHLHTRDHRACGEDHREFRGERLKRSLARDLPGGVRWRETHRAATNSGHGNLLWTLLATLASIVPKVNVSFRLSDAAEAAASTCDPLRPNTLAATRSRAAVPVSRRRPLRWRPRR